MAFSLQVFELRQATDLHSEDLRKYAAMVEEATLEATGRLDACNQRDRLQLRFDIHLQNILDRDEKVEVRAMTQLVNCVPPYNNFFVEVVVGRPTISSDNHNLFEI